MYAIASEDIFSKPLMGQGTAQILKRGIRVSNWTYGGVASCNQTLCLRSSFFGMSPPIEVMGNHSAACLRHERLGVNDVMFDPLGLRLGKDPTGR